MRNWIFRLEIFGTLLGLMAGLATAFLDIKLFSNVRIPLENLKAALNFDLIYPIFFQLFFYAYLLNTRRFVGKNLLIGTTFFIVATLVGFALLFAVYPETDYLPRFKAAFPGYDLVPTLANISIQRLTWSFFLMLLALLVARLLKRRQDTPQV